MSERGISITLKYPKPKYQDAPWIVFHGTPAEVREDIIAAFAWDGETVTDLNLHEVTLKAQEAIQGAGNVANTLGGKVLSDGGGQPQGVWSQAGSGASAQAEGAEEQPPADPTAWLKVEIEKSTGIAALQRLWADNKAAFSEHPELMDAYKAKGKALSA